MLQPIETKYHGHRFRSRLEARWAVFFDAFGLAWEYEPEGYDLGDAGSYLPDFLVAGKVVVEVKRPNYEPTDADWERWEAMVFVPGVELFVLADGVPTAHPNAFYYGVFKNCRVPERTRYALVHCAECWQLGFGRLDSSGDVVEILRLCGELEHADWDHLKDSCEEMTRAKYARFEHGETPAMEKVVHYEPRYRRRTFAAPEPAIAAKTTAPSWREVLEDAADLPPEKRELYLELQSAIAEMRSAVGRDKCKFFDRVADLQRRWMEAA